MKLILQHKIFPLILLCFTTFAFGQLENANWYFGENGAGLNFNGTTTVLTNGQTPTKNNHSATISNENGILLFYTDGSSVWNATQNVMTNGNNTLLGAGKTVVIVPFPGNTNKYYIFTSKDTFSGTHFYTTYYYSVVNLTNGLGVVENLNTPLNGVLPFSNGAEADFWATGWRDHMSVAKHSDGESYWLLINPFNYMFALKIDANGISSPVISSIEGNYVIGPPSPLDTIDAGSSGMSVSPNQQNIAYFTNYFIQGSGNQSEVHLYDFNNTTGSVVINSFIRDFDYNNVIFGLGLSVEFSPDNNYLYLYGQGASSHGAIYQIDLNNISANPFLLYSSNGLEIPETDKYSMRLAIDGKIYVPTINNDFLSVINNPNISGTSSNFTENQINLMGGSSKLLPQLVPIQYSSVSCPSDLVITQTVNSGENDIQESSNTIIALNIVESGANAEYDSVKFVKLTPGFHAKAGATFRAYIEGCTTMAPRFSNESQAYLKDKTNLERLTLYPNPAKSQITITSKKPMKHLVLSSHIGRTYLDISIDKKEVLKTRLSLDNLPTGIYIVRVFMQNGEIITKQVVKK